MLVIVFQFFKQLRVEIAAYLPMRNSFLLAIVCSIFSTWEGNTSTVKYAVPLDLIVSLRMP